MYNYTGVACPNMKKESARALCRKAKKRFLGKAVQAACGAWQMEGSGTTCPCHARLGAPVACQHRHVFA